MIVYVKSDSASGQSLLPYEPPTGPPANQTPPFVSSLTCAARRVYFHCSNFPAAVRRLAGWPVEEREW